MEKVEFYTTTSLKLANENIMYHTLLEDIHETRKTLQNLKDEYTELSKSLDDKDEHKLTGLYSKLEVIEVQLNATSVQLKDFMKKKSKYQLYVKHGYIIVKTLGRGSYGSVFLATKDDDMFVLKTVSSKNDDDTIPNEVKILKQLQHIEGVPKLHDFYKNDKACVIVMDYLPESVDLLKWKDNGNDDEDKIMDVFKKLVSILINIDKAGFVHRDIKLENVIVNDDMVVRVIDFDHCIEKGKEPFTKFNGTVSYYPPEWFENGKCQSEPMTVWSLGVLLYKLLTGCNPFPNVHKFDPGFKRVVNHKNLFENLFQHDPDERISLVGIYDKFC